MEVLAGHTGRRRKWRCPGIDGQTFEDVEASGTEAILKSIRDDLLAGLTNRE